MRSVSSAAKTISPLCSTVGPPVQELGERGERSGGEGRKEVHVIKEGGEWDGREGGGRKMGQYVHVTQ